jgi:BON domain
LKWFHQLLIFVILLVLVLLSTFYQGVGVKTSKQNSLPRGGLTMKALLITLLAISALGVASCKSPQPVDDSVITTKVKSKLAADTRTSAIKISVETTNGVVALTGTVPTQSEKSAAEEIAKSTEGVKSVDNKIAVNPR